MSKQWPFRWDLLLRYRLIEIVAQWEGRLTTNHLCNSFGIGRQQASKDINAYIADIGPGNLEYDRQLRGYKPTAQFKPVLSSGIADEYLHVLDRNQDISHTFEGLDLGAAHTEILQVPTRTVDPLILRAIIQACREQKRLEIAYLSLTNPEAEERIINPHTLVFTGLRWHVRAYCEKNRSFRDFVLSRFRGVPEIMDKALASADMDERWHTRVDIQLTPDTRLSEAQQAVIASDYGMHDMQLNISVRASLVEYALQALNVDPRKIEAKPEAQQIVVKNLAEIEKWLF